MSEQTEKRQTLAWIVGYKTVEKTLFSVLVAAAIIGWGRRDNPWWVSWSWVSGVLMVIWFAITYVKVEVDATNSYVFERRRMAEWLVFVGKRDETIVTEETPFLKIAMSPWSRCIVMKDLGGERQYRFGSRYLIGRKRLLRTLSSYGKSITEMVSEIEQKARKGASDK
ncbi:MAG: hypothetical protein HY897_19500 [Deltaproteobacteria bacterium]|nr:hypothetical protein [Deltaproteobacteria bacterium]